jgi:hypothetical protein
MKKLACAVALFSLALTGCSGSLCDDFDDSGKTLVEKVENCPSFDEVTYEEPTEAERQACEDSLEACTDSDKEALNKFIDCVNDLPECTASTEQSFAASFLACAAPLQSVSDACGAGSTDGAVRKGMAMVKGR